MANPLQSKQSRKALRALVRRGHWRVLGAAGLALGLLVLSLPGPPTALAFSAQFAVNLTIQGGAMMDIDPVTNPGAMQHLIEQYSDVLPAELATHPAYVARISFGHHAGLRPKVSLMQPELTASAAGAPPQTAHTFAVPQIRGDIAQALVGAYLQRGTAPAGTYHATATVQVLFE